MLFEKYQSIKKFFNQIGVNVPNYVYSNVKHNLREYQEGAIENFIYWDREDKEERLTENHCLFQMATGSGKTLLMASLVLYLHKKGYRKFIFFVDSTAIVNKTKDNFINQLSPKYLFNENLEIDGKNIEIKEIKSLDDADSENINILFTTIQGLHGTLTSQRENAPTFDDFKNHKVVFLADEAHHNNTQTKKGLKLEASWENTIDHSFKKNKDNYLIELTATANLGDIGIKAKYQNKVIYNYDLKSFRKDGYSKDIRVVNTNLELKERILLAVIMSEFRRYIAGTNNLQIKPIILFKSKIIKESENNQELFNKILDELCADDLEQISKNLEKEISNSFLKAIKDFIDNETDYLVRNIPLSFHKDKSQINVNNEKSNIENQFVLNNLESIHNPIRAIFAVDKLNEGWDVQNLYDIVKLYETRNVKTTAVSEIQLIGRGARYFPFLLDGQDAELKYKRKFDGAIDENSHLKVLEQLHYHSLNEVEFINELNKQLEIIGLTEGALKEVSIQLKDSFKDTNFYKYGLIFVNEKRKKDRRFKTLKRQKQHRLFNDEQELFIPTENITIDLTKIIKEHHIEDGLSDNLEFKKFKTYKVGDIDNRIFYKAISRFEFFELDSINKYIDGGVKSLLDIKELFKQSSITFHYKDGLQILDKYVFDGLVSLFPKLIDKMDIHKDLFFGTREFIAKPIKSTFKNSKINIQKDIKNERVIEDTSNIQYFVQKSFYGDSGYEKSLIEDLNIFFNEDENKKIYSEVYMIRNYGNFKLYNFEDGKGFEPDFILFLKKDGRELIYQMFVEPKGEHLSQYDEWKEKFLEIMCQEKNPDFIELKGGKDKDGNALYKIIGLPFYNTENSNDFKNYLNETIDSKTQTQ